MSRIALLMCLDTEMLLLVCVFEPIKLTGLEWHEWLGFTLCPLVLLHVTMELGPVAKIQGPRSKLQGPIVDGVVVITGTLHISSIRRGLLKEDPTARRPRMFRREATTELSQIFHDF